MLTIKLEQPQAAQTDEKERLLAEYQARLEELARATKAAEEAKAAAPADKPENEAQNAYDEAMER